MKLKIKSLKNFPYEHNLVFFHNHHKVWQFLISKLWLTKAYDNAYNVENPFHEHLECQKKTFGGQVHAMHTMLMDFHNLQGWHVNNEITAIHLSNYIWLNH
jgi:hypothetical protein